jgi:hypothetical protein
MRHAGSRGRERGMLIRHGRMVLSLRSGQPCVLLSETPRAMPPLDLARCNYDLNPLDWDFSCRAGTGRRDICHLLLCWQRLAGRGL